MANIIPIERIENKIYLIRGQKVMLDSDLALLYGVETKRLNEQVRRNIKRFPDDFMFQLARYESEYLERELLDQNIILKSQIATSSQANISGKSVLRSQIATLKEDRRGQHKKYFPYVFTEQGVAMLSTVLNSERAIAMNIIIMRTFVKIRQLVYSYKDLAEKIEKIEKDHGKKIGEIFRVLDFLTSDKEKSDKKEIGFKG
jgi:hypothetical protein